MKKCIGCRHVDWDRTKDGKLIPSETGRCRKEVQLTILPVCMQYHWKPFIVGGIIYRKEIFKEDCIYWEK